MADAGGRVFLESLVPHLTEEDVFVEMEADAAELELVCPGWWRGSCDSHQRQDIEDQRLY